MRPRVSIIIPAHNAQRWIRHTVLSCAFQQTHGMDHEIVVVNDGSTDGTAHILTDMAAELPKNMLRVVEQDNRGESEAINKGVEAARGEHLLFCDHDDQLSSRAAVLLSDGLTRHGVVFGDKAGFKHTEGTRKPTILYTTRRARYVVSATDSNTHPLLHTNFPNHPRAVRKSIFEEIGGMDTTLPGAADYDFMLRVIFPRHRTERTLGYIPEVLYFYREHADSLSKMKPGRVRQDCAIAVTRTLQRLGESKEASPAGKDALGQLYFAHVPSGTPVERPAI